LSFQEELAAAGTEPITICIPKSIVISERASSSAGEASCLSLNSIFLFGTVIREPIAKRFVKEESEADLNQIRLAIGIMSISKKEQSFREIL
jgi:hypothetical protein